MTAGASWGAADAGLGEIFECAGDFISQLRRGVKVATAASRAAAACRAAASRAGAAGTATRASSGPGGSERSGPWGQSFGGYGAAGHWGGGFAGQRRTAWWPGSPQGPGPGRPRKASRGDVRSAILALLRQGPLNGYQIMAEIEERSGGAWRPSPGAVYPALAQLADEGLIVGEESGGRRTFRLTDAGREYVDENPEMARGAWESAEQQEAWRVPGLFAEAARLGHGIVQLAHAGSAAQVRAAERLLKNTRRELYRILADEAEDAEDEADGVAEDSN
jgi:DNA-binding PadR family transcriptional regulator